MEASQPEPSERTGMEKIWLAVTRNDADAVKIDPPQIREVRSIQLTQTAAYVRPLSVNYARHRRRRFILKFVRSVARSDTLLLRVVGTVRCVI